SLITLFPILTLLLFGGATLKDLAFALLLGIASGASPSSCSAAPLLSMWKGHESEYRRRQATGIEKATLGTVTPALAGAGAASAVPVTKKADQLAETVPVPELSDEERAAREAAKRRREERR